MTVETPLMKHGMWYTGTPWHGTFSAWCVPQAAYNELAAELHALQAGISYSCCGIVR